MSTHPRKCFSCSSQHAFASTQRNNNCCESPQFHSPVLPRHLSCEDGPNSCSCHLHNNSARTVPECSRETYCCSTRTRTPPVMGFGADFVVHPQPVSVLKQYFQQSKQHIENVYNTTNTTELGPNTSVPNQITLSNWYLIKRGTEVSVGGFTLETAGNQKVETAPISERIEKCMLLAKDGLKVKLIGLIDDGSTLSNGFSMKIVYSFLSGFPYTWNHLLGIKIASHASGRPSSDNNNAQIYYSVGKDKQPINSCKMNHTDVDSQKENEQNELGNAMNRDANTDKTKPPEDSLEDQHRNVAEGELDHLNSLEQTTCKVSSRTQRLMQRLERRLEGTLLQKDVTKASELKKCVKKKTVISMNKQLTPEKIVKHHKKCTQQSTKKLAISEGKIKSHGLVEKKKNRKINAVNHKNVTKDQKQNTRANDLPHSKPSPSNILPPLPRPRVLVSKRLISAAFGLKLSSSGRLLVPPLAHWCNQIPLRDKDGGIIAISDGSTDVINTSTGNSKFTPPSGENLKKLRKRLCEVAVETPKKKAATYKR